MQPFDKQLLLADEGYEGGSDIINVPTLLRKHHESTMFPALNILHFIQTNYTMEHTMNSTQTSMQTTLIQFNR